MNCLKPKTTIELLFVSGFFGRELFYFCKEQLRRNITSTKRDFQQMELF